MTHTYTYYVPPEKRKTLGGIPFIFHKNVIMVFLLYQLSALYAPGTLYRYLCFNIVCGTVLSGFIYGKQDT